MERGYKAERLTPAREMFFVLLLGVLVWEWGDWAMAQGGPGKMKPPVVTVQAVTEQEVNPPSEYVGRVEAIQAVDLRARVEGYLEKVAFKEGGDVVSGDLLYVIEQAPYRARVNESKAKVAECRARLTKAEQYLKRLNAVHTGGVSATDLETAASEHMQAKAQLQESEAALEQAELDLGYTTIRAPIHGRIGPTAFTRGNLVEPGSGALARLVQLNPIRVVYSVSENDFLEVKQAFLRKGLSEKEIKDTLVPAVQLPHGELYEHPGRVDFVDNQVDPKTGTIAVRAVFDNPDALLLPGQYVTVVVKNEESARLPVIPQSAVLEDREGRYVLMVDPEGKVMQRRIRTGPALGTAWAVQSGLRAGEIIVVQGIQKAMPGQVVETVQGGGANEE